MALSKEQKNTAQLAQERQADSTTSESEDESTNDTTTLTPENTGEQIIISPLEAVLMLFIGLFVDGAQFFIGFVTTGATILTPIGVAINFLIDVVVGIWFFLWFKLKGVSTSKKGGKMMLIGLASAFGIELIPFLDWLPAWTGYIITILLVQFIKYAMKNSRTAQRILKNRVLQ